MEQLIRELILIGIVLTITLVAYLFIRRSGGTASENAGRVLTGVMGAFMLLGGTAKFFEPFTTMFANQIALSRLPFPTLSAFAGQAGEITSGLVLLAFFAFGRKFDGAVGDKVFYLANLLIVVIMAVAVYVHLHPGVPAETLPFQSKPPVLTVIVMLLAGLNMYLHWNNQHALTHSGQKNSRHQTRPASA